jgi:hypothetical protein
MSIAAKPTLTRSRYATMLEQEKKRDQAPADLAEGDSAIGSNTSSPIVHKTVDSGSDPNSTLAGTY